MTSIFNHNINATMTNDATNLSYLPLSHPSLSSTFSTASSDPIDNYTVINEGKTKKFICNFSNCQKTFRFKSEIERHLSAHSGLRPHNCTFPGCKKSFKRVDALDDHIRSQHTGEAPLICPHPDCGLRFSTTAKLRYHSALHEDQKPYKCAVDGCDRSFVTLSQLRQHEKSTLAHRRLGLTPERKESNMSGYNRYENESPVTKFSYGQEEEMVNVNMMGNEAKKRVKYDYENENGDYYGMPKYESVENGYGYNNEVQMNYQHIKLDEQPFEKKEFLSNVVGENDALKKRLNYTESMIYAMKGQLDKVMLMLPNGFDHMKLLGYNNEAGAGPYEGNGLAEGLLPEIDNFFF